MGWRVRAGVFLMVVAAAVPSAAQSPARTFDAVSIKRNRTTDVASDTNTTPGRLSLVNATMLSVVLRAFGVLRPQVALEDLRMAAEPGFVSLGGVRD